MRHTVARGRIGDVDFIADNPPDRCEWDRMQERTHLSQSSRENELAPPKGSAAEVLRVFTWLGLTSFGGPIAHLGYFRKEWSAVRGQQSVQSVMRGINAAVVGLLAAALYHPVWTSAVSGLADVAIALLGFVLLVACKAPPVLVMVLTASAAIGLALTS